MKKRASRIAFALCSFCFTLILGEVMLHYLGYRPGIYTRTEMFRPVDSLILYQNFENDEDGIYHFSSLVYDSLESCFDCKNLSCNTIELQNKFHKNDDPFAVYRAFCNLNTDIPNDSELGNALRNIRQNPIWADSSWVDALTTYTTRPFNKEGFKGIPTQPYTSTRCPKIMLVGDSFVYGLSASPITGSFYDRLLARGYLIYNFGIPGTDPAQYAAIIEKYIALLKPDAVVVCFFPGNDLMKFERQVKKEYPIEHLTNAGMLNTIICGQYYDAKSAYAYYLNLISVPQQGTFGKICSQSIISSLFWGLLYQVGWVAHPDREKWEQCDGISTETSIKITRTYIDQWESVCKKENVRLFNAILPDIDSKANDQNGLRTDRELMEKLFGQNYRAPADYRFKAQEHYYGDDKHFNSDGSRIYANFLDSMLRQAGITPQP